MRNTQIRAVLFDFDGTLTKPGALDFEHLRRELECPPGIAILEYLETLPQGRPREAKLDLLDAYELQAAATSEPNSGAERTVFQLREMGLRVGMFTRNTTAAVARSLENFTHLNKSDFAVLLTRDDSGPVKPHPESVPHAAALLGVEPYEVMVVGDHRFDIEAARSAGSWSCLLSNTADLDRSARDLGADYAIASLDELPDILTRHRPLAVGKLPREQLAPLLDELQTADSAARVLIGPKIGEDTAVVHGDKDEVIVLKSDPITFATDQVGRYAVCVSANDLVCSGAEPNWFLAAVLMPPNSTLYAVETVFHQIESACRELGITVVGGHTEITEAVTHALVCGTMAGTVHRDALVDKRAIQPGDAIILTKCAGLEGTAILCTEFAGRLLDEGIPETELQKGRAFVQELSVVPEAQIATKISGLHGMHDVTEGGVITALQELAQAGNVSLTVDLKQIPTAEITKRVCSALALDPLGLIGSGSLVIAVANQSREAMLAALEMHGVPAAGIGEAGSGPAGELRALYDGRPVECPSFAVDEIARLFSQM